MASNLTKSRNFTFLLYPESIPSDWEDCLIKLGIPMVVSPLHDKDIKTNEKEWSTHDVIHEGKHYKKPHYHVIYVAKNPVTIESVRNKIKRALGSTSVSHIEIVDSIENTFKYLTHESADAKKKKKHVYDKQDLLFINDFDIDRYITLDETQKKELFNSITRVIVANKFENIFDLSNYIINRGGEIGIESLDVMNDVIAPKTGLLRLYFDGAYQIRKRGETQIIDTETGEIK